MDAPLDHHSHHNRSNVQMKVLNSMTENNVEGRDGVQSWAFETDDTDQTDTSSE